MEIIFQYDTETGFREGIEFILQSGSKEDDWSLSNI
jgi:hypothetical protein